MSETNPYSPPSTSSFGGSPSSGASGDVPAEILESMRKTRPWVLFLSIVGFIFTGLVFVGGLAVMGVASSARLPWQIGLIYMVMGILMFFPALFMCRYAMAIRPLLDGGGMSALAVAIDKQKSYWRLVGIAGLVVLCLYGLIFVGAIVAGAVAGSRRF